jgi:tryptophan-rich sensory protein
MTRAGSRRPILVAALVAFGVALLGGAMTDTGDWYRRLEKSPANPPDWLFAPAWTAIYALTVVAAVGGWQALRTSSERAWMLSLFFVNAVLNVLWTAAFFTLRRPDWALAEVATLWLSVAALIAFFWGRQRRSSLLLAPYLLWVSFAAFLNLEVVRRNGPFA